ncbi:DNA repair protein RecO [Methylobrevis pamukkalensis]|uniref:DNA repair protein RecO n=1 Tax=Methylobrevis pamukkalensis TaxID=1439726 RepID=A0A1E3H4I7_9HYPH|nr:DNA repair protein RecO [Methylobrevis pamukkalensis]
MEWTGEGFVLGTRAHGETSLILEVMRPSAGGISVSCAAVGGGATRRCSSPATRCS